MSCDLLVRQLKSLISKKKLDWLKIRHSHKYRMSQHLVISNFHFFFPQDDFKCVCIIGSYCALMIFSSHTFLLQWSFFLSLSCSIEERRLGDCTLGEGTAADGVSHTNCLPSMKISWHATLRLRNSEKWVCIYRCPLVKTRAGLGWKQTLWCFLKRVLPSLLFFFCWFSALSFRSRWRSRL